MIDQQSEPFASLVHKKFPVTKSHPLEGVAIAAFRARPQLDRVILAEAFKSDVWGSCHLRRNKKAARMGMAADRAYLVVAEDVLLYMQSQGKVREDSCGWFSLVEIQETPEKQGVSS